MAKVTILTVKKALAAAFPDIEFTYGVAGRGRQRANAVSWVGGPLACDVRAAAGHPYQGHFVAYHFVREPTPEEWEEIHRKLDEEHRGRVAAEPARRAAAKAEGIEKRKATAAATKARRNTLAAAFPGVEFGLSSAHRWNEPAVWWVDGPTVAEVTTLLSIEARTCQRRLTPEFAATEASIKAAEASIKAAKASTNRLAKRLAQSKARALRIAKGAERRRTAHLPHLPRLDRPSPQFILPLDFPIWENPRTYVLVSRSAAA